MYSWCESNGFDTMETSENDGNGYGSCEYWWGIKILTNIQKSRSYLYLCGYQYRRREQSIEYSDHCKLYVHEFYLKEVSFLQRNSLKKIYLSNLLKIHQKSYPWDPIVCPRLFCTPEHRSSVTLTRCHRLNTGVISTLCFIFFIFFNFVFETVRTKRWD